MSIPVHALHDYSVILLQAQCVCTPSTRWLKKTVWADARFCAYFLPRALSQIEPCIFLLFNFILVVRVYCSPTPSKTMNLPTPSIDSYNRNNNCQLQVITMGGKAGWFGQLCCQIRFISRILILYTHYYLKFISMFS